MRPASALGASAAWEGVHRARRGTASWLSPQQMCTGSAGAARKRTCSSRKGSCPPSHNHCCRCRRPRAPPPGPRTSHVESAVSGGGWDGRCRGAGRCMRQLEQAACAHGAARGGGQPPRPACIPRCSCHHPIAPTAPSQPTRPARCRIGNQSPQGWCVACGGQCAARDGSCAHSRLPAGAGIEQTRLVVVLASRLPRAPAASSIAKQSPRKTHALLTGVSMDDMHAPDGELMIPCVHTSRVCTSSKPCSSCQPRLALLLVLLLPPPLIPCAPSYKRKRFEPETPPCCSPAAASCLLLAPELEPELRLCAFIQPGPYQPALPL